VRTRWPERLAALALAALALTAAACGRGGAVAAPAPQQPRDGGTLTYALAADPVSVTPLYGGDPNGTVIERNVFAGLVKADPGTLQPVPSIARSWSSSSDGKRWTFRLRPGVRFGGDAGPVTAQTFVDDWGLLCSPSVHSPNAAVLAPVAGYAGCRAGAGLLAGVQAPDPQTLRVMLSRPVWDFPARLLDPATWAFPPQLAQTRAQRRAFENAPVGAGPFQVRMLRRSSRMKGKAPVAGLVVLARNPDYFGPAPHLNAVQLPVVTGTDAARTFAAFRAGHYQALPVPAAAGDVVRADPAFQRRLVVAPRLSLYALRSSAATPVRLAVAGALDRQQVAALALGKSAQAADGLLPAGMPGYTPEMASYPRIPGARPFVRLTRETGTLGQLTDAVAQVLRQRGLTVRVVPHGDWTVTQTDLASPSPGAGLAAVYGAGQQAAAPIDAARGAAVNQAVMRVQRALLASGAVVPLAFGQQELLVAPRVRNLRLDALGAPDLAGAWLVSPR
jgi:ABC-type transport system substrate-binding protein